MFFCPVILTFDRRLLQVEEALVRGGAEVDGDEEQRMVWKVKRRPDGSRYIVRRPVHSRVLRSRELKINAERTQNCQDLTTEDDTMSEIKLGRYWSKDERKKHMERAKERRSRQEQVLESVKMMQRKNQLNVATTAMAVVPGNGEEVIMMASNGPAKGAKPVPTDQQPPGLVPGVVAGECNDNKVVGLLSVTTV